VHLDRLDLGADASGGEDDGHAWLEEAGLDTADRNSSNTANLVDILERKAERLVDGALGGLDLVERIDQAVTLVPRHVRGLGEHVITLPSGDGDEGDLLGLVADLLEVHEHGVLDLLVAGLGVLDRLVVHLVDSDDHLLDTEGEGKQGVLAGLAVLGDGTLETTSIGWDDEDGDIGLGGTGDHVLDEITVAWGIDDGEVELVRLELPQGDIDGDTALTLGLEFVKDPGVLERGLAHLGGLLLELLDGTLVDTTALVDEVASGGGLTGIDVADDDEVDVNLILGHLE
jgi:hypothetical protein